ncbi:MAG: UvrD-helicase domain-containing protein [Ardenticatenales bacterium]|nr:UvrD-helicase domain-containing protein [Ardenticatenales bacterium]
MSLLHGLNQPQYLAVTAPDGPILVLAGPGSGKTRVLTQRIAYLIQEKRIPPWRILAVTFTNKAAREMRHRIEALLGEPPRGLTMGTFHATCAQILRREALHLPHHTNDFVIFDTDDQRQVIKQALRKLNLDDKKFPPAKMLNYISAAKNEFITADEYAATNYVSEVVRRVYACYQELLQANNAMDFDDLLMNTLLLFDNQPDVLAKYQERYLHILVDEFQDTNTTQYGLLHRLALGHGNIFVVGDADQSIYKWRGADVRNINRFREQYPNAQTILLEQNYRSTQIILDAAKSVIQHNRDRVHKDLFTDREGGAKIIIREAYDEREEAVIVVDTIANLVLEGYEPGDVAIMYRTNAQSRALEEAFLMRKLPYKLVGATRFYGRREIKDIIAYLRLVHNPADAISFNRVINTPPRSIGKKTQEQLQDWATANGWQPGQALVRLVTDPDLQYPFNGRALKGLLSFATMLYEWTMLSDGAGVGEIMDLILRDVGYRGYIDDDTEEGEDRWGNVMELRAVANIDEEITLPAFLEQIALVSDADTVEETTNAPTLLTLHAAKGLEFPIVFITGLEEGILPHARAFEDGEELAEERRLFYVGLTRAKDRLYLLHAFRRTSYGMTETAQRSAFLHEIPGDLVEGGNGGSRPTRRATSRDWQWNRPTPAAPARPSPIASSSRENKEPSFSKTTTRSWKRPSNPVTSREPRPQPPPEPQRRTYRTGQRVRHARFGEGFVIETKRTGDDEEVVIAFSNEGIKRLAASMANLELIE